jgi:methionyl-tRNA formyltransferase
MRIVILTSSRKGTASYCLPLLKNNTGAEIVRVIVSQGQVVKNRKFYLKKIKKILKIGLPGALNGIRIRSWFNGLGLKNNLQDIVVLCNELNVPVTETPAVNNPLTVQLMREANADLAISLGNSYIPKKIFTQAKHGMINIHGEVLPDFQNAQSVIWQLYENRAETGYTIHRIDSKIDTGDILKMEKYPIIFKDTFENTVRAMADETLAKAGNGLVDVINHFEQYLKEAKPQGKGKTYTTPSIKEFWRMKSNFKKLKSGIVPPAEK